MTVLAAYSDQEINDYLRQQVRDGTVETDSETLQRQSFSAETVVKDSALARAFVSVKSVADIQGVLRTARRFHLPVVPQSAFTNTVISADGIAGAIILSTREMDQILEIDQADLLAVVQPGVINNDLDQAARKQGLFYGPDPGSRLISSVGGNAATNAGGMSTVRFGATKDNVLGLKVVLADGRLVKVGGRTLKQAFGYDLTQLFVGSEGTLGIIYEITVKLLPIPLGTPTVGRAFFPSLGELAAAVQAIRLSGLYPTTLEAVDAETMTVIDQYEHTHYAQPGESMLVFRLDNSHPEEQALLEKIVTQHHGHNFQQSTDPQEQAALMQARRDLLPAVVALVGKNHLSEDMAVPISQLATLMDYLQTLERELNITIYKGGHAGDGNIHPIFVWSGSAEVPEVVLEALRRTFRKTLELGGTISGEHAVGMLKNQWNNAELGETVDELQHQIKHLFDPMGILNPQRKID
ncbi:FAD-binding oxidoreductase [Lapidilactobacillus wuchangensis]|uniref:FAD-binding oxidoreductase n=1 Tax=Lapidilactobacillus wuchangensis TaxID=2486001 RepID=UPI000F79BF85|nr:FAD-linked oxidase C-terminal domain-containing protein [Lapidilactobacillus wuchangensis]